MSSGRMSDLTQANFRPETIDWGSAPLSRVIPVLGRM